MLPEDKPKARSTGLVIEQLEDDVLVYDLDRHKAHCLNRTAALVWNYCDGQANVDEIVQRMAKELKTRVDRDIVLYALHRLDKALLLQERMPRPAVPAGVSRREVMRKVGLGAAVAIPMVFSIVAPTAAAAATGCAKTCRSASQTGSAAACGACANVVGTCWGSKTCFDEPVSSTCAGCNAALKGTNRSWSAP